MVTIDNQSHSIVLKNMRAISKYVHEPNASNAAMLTTFTDEQCFKCKAIKKLRDKLWLLETYGRAMRPESSQRKLTTCVVIKVRPVDHVTH